MLLLPVNLWFHAHAQYSSIHTLVASARLWFLESNY
jgi:hypothetical protein